MDEIEEVGAVETVGERLRAAREAKKLSIEDIAAATRIPTRHLESLETSDWDKLPAPTYSMGFAKNYAAAVGLDRAEIADQLRGEMGGLRPATYATTEVFEPIDPKRVMPKGLVLGALAALLLVALLLSWLSNRETGDDGAAPAAEAPATAAAAAIVEPATAGPVVVTANDRVWVDIRDGATILQQGELAPGQSFEVPATAVAPTLTTAKAEALRISVGTADAPAIGPAATKVTVSLKPDDLMKGGRAIASPPAPASAPPPATTEAAPKAKPAAVKPKPKPPAPAPVPTTVAPATTAPVTTNTATP